MQVIGCLDNKNSTFHGALNNGEFRDVVKSNEFNLFSDADDSDKELLYYSQNNIHLVLSGYVTNGHGSTANKSGNILKLIIDDYLIKSAECFDSLDGSYFVVLWDGNKKTLYLNRDIYGTKLLYYYFSPANEFVFSNNLNTILKVTGLKNISIKSLHEYLRFMDISPPYTIYEDIYFLEPGKILVANGKGVALKNIPIRPSVDFHRGEPETYTINKFKDLLYESVYTRMENAYRTGIFLSGGIDSTLLCAIAAKAKGNIKAYTVGFEDPLLDESNIAQNVAGYLGIEHQVFKFNIEDDYNAFNNFVSNISSPFADPAVIPTFQCFERISDNVDVVLDGTGGDSLIGIMPARHIRFVLEYSSHIPYKLRLLLLGLLKKHKGLSSYSPLFDFKNAVELLIRWQGWTEDEISLLCNAKCNLSHTRFYKIFAENSEKEPYELYSMLLGSTADDRQHQTAPLFGLNIAYPYWDRNVQKFVKQLPLEYKYNNGTSKILFRRLLEEFIPSNIWDKPKHSFDYPFEKLLRHNDCELPKSYLSKNAVNEHMLFIPLVAEKYLQRFLKGDASVKFKIWALVVFQAWYFNYYKQL